MSDIESAFLKQGLIKLTPKTDNRYRQVAKFLFLIGEAQAAQVLKQLSESQIEKIISELVTIRHVPPDEAEALLREFSSLYQEGTVLSGGAGTARSMLVKAFGEKKADLLLQRTVPTPQKKPFAFLDAVSTHDLHQLLAPQLPATKVLVLSQLAPESAARYIKALPLSEKKDIMLRLAKMHTVDNAILMQVSESLEKTYHALQAKEQQTDIDGKAVLAEILKKSDMHTETKILHALNEVSPTLEESIRQKLFTIEDVLDIDDLFLQKKLKSFSDIQLAKILMHKDSAFVKKLLSNVSKNRVQLILDEQATLYCTKKESIRETQGFLASLRNDYEHGRLSLSKGQEDVWV